MSTPAKSDTLKIQEAADLLQVHPMTLYKLARSKKIPARRVGNQWRFSRLRLNQWLYQGGNA